MTYSWNCFDLVAISHHPKLQDLIITHNRIIDLTPLCNLQSLKSINAKYNQIESLPFKTSNLYNLKSLNVSYNALFFLGNIESLQSLVEFRAGNFDSFFELTYSDHNVIRNMCLKEDMKCLLTVSINNNALDMFDCRHLVAIQNLFVNENQLGPFIHEYKVETLLVLSCENQKTQDPLYLIY